MKLKNFRQKYNGILQKFIRLFSLTSMAFVVTACYGSPYAEYEVKGIVSNEEGDPLKCMDVKVRVVTDYSEDRQVTDHTNTAGHYHVNFGVTSFGGDRVEVIVSDRNGVYESDTVYIKSDEMKMKAGDGWSSYYSAEADVQLKKK